mgnify:CR=1 FL=1
MSECRFMHVGMTVSDLQQTEAFYTRYFGFKQTLDSCFKPEFFAAYESLYHLPNGTGCRFGFLEAPDGTVIELSSSASRFHARQLFGTSPAITISA